MASWEGAPGIALDARTAGLGGSYDAQGAEPVPNRGLERIVRNGVNDPDGAGVGVGVRPMQREQPLRAAWKMECVEYGLGPGEVA